MRPIGVTSKPKREQVMKGRGVPVDITNDLLILFILTEEVFQLRWMAINWVLFTCCIQFVLAGSLYSPRYAGIHIVYALWPPQKIIVYAFGVCSYVTE